ncbi:hypothetical protein A8L34_27975 [Bacillus sp. FJAT-27264]|uniref:hypothetical protein n=1 Tax=Paenibacillus sp. (strain DSM 101736 / FJAT-27264) TaxID=1850362 RepID=UPI000807D2C9|nr:hypothetical protein [Bacillus sp. FJAT-27264]OBZ15887.1 hypothetical protein A8L34_27975 [Bacillus sp. FJAT-27264]
MKEAELNRLKSELNKIISMCNTEEARILLSDVVVDIPQIMQILNLSIGRAYKQIAKKSLESVVGNHIYLRRDIENLKNELESAREKFGIGWSEIEPNEWVFSQENVLKVLLDTYKMKDSDMIPLRDIINNLTVNRTMEYSDKSVRVLYTLKKLMNRGLVSKPKAGFYNPIYPDRDIKDQLSIAKDYYANDFGEFSTEQVYQAMKRLDRNISVKELSKELNQGKTEENKAKNLIRRALNRLLRDNRIVRVDRGYYSINEDQESGNKEEL